MAYKNKQNASLSNYKRFILVIFVCLFIFSSPLTTPQAHALWPDIPGFTYKQMLEDIRDRIKGIVMGMLKQQAVQMLTKQVDSLISGGGSGGNAKFITDWESYLYKTPDNNTKLYMNDKLSQMFSGRGSTSGYKSEGFGSGSSYAAQLMAMAKAQTINRKDPTFTYEGNPANMFSGNNWKKYNSYLFNDMNNPWGASVATQNIYYKKKAEERNLAAVKSQANLGGIGVGEGPNGKGKITLPGAVVPLTKANTMDAGTKVIASAQHPEEVISALVSKIMTQAFKQGISMAASKLGVSPSMLSGLASSLSPSSFYNSSSSQSTAWSASSYDYPSSSSSSDSSSTAWSASSYDYPSSSATTNASRSSIPPPERNF